MKKSTQILRQTLVLLAFLTLATVAKAQQPRNVIIYIGDGYGIAPKTAARMA